MPSTLGRSFCVALAPLLLAALSMATACSQPAGTSSDDAGNPSASDGGPIGVGDGDARADARDVPSGDAGIDANADAAGDGGTSCPAGSTLRKSLASCPGAPLSPPAALTGALTTATPGDVVSMAGMNEDDAPCLPVVVCTPNDAPALLFSDSPEQPAQDGVLYADTLAAGHYRFYVYHANGGATLRKFPLVALNSGAAPAKITIVRRGLAAPSTAYVSVGKTVLLDWLTDRAPVDVTVPAGERVLLDSALDDLHAAQNELVHAIYDVVTTAPLKISFVSVLANADAATATAGLSLLPRDVDHQRGTFPSADVLVVPAGDAGAPSGVSRLRLGLDQVDDTLTGIDAPTGDKQSLAGNYGLLYRFALNLTPTAIAAIAPRGGEWGGAARAALSVALPTATQSLGTTTDAIVVGPLTSELRLLTAGGSNLPVDLFVVSP